MRRLRLPVVVTELTPDQWREAQVAGMLTPRELWDPEELREQKGPAYEPPVRVYFDTAALVKAEVAEVRADGSVLATDSLPVSGKPFIEAVSADDIPPELRTGQWTASYYLQCANAVLQLHRAEALAQAFPMGAARREKKRAAKQQTSQAPALQAEPLRAESAGRKQPQTAHRSAEQDPAPSRQVGVWAGPLPVLLGLLVGVLAVWRFGVAGALAPAVLGLAAMQVGRSSPAAGAIIGRAGVGAVFGVLGVSLLLVAQVMFPGTEA